MRRFITIAVFYCGIIFGGIISGTSVHTDDVEAIQRRTYTVEAQHCLAKTIYFEARNESVAGMLAVGLVVLNRTESQKFPSSICAVVTQGRYTGTKIAYPASKNARTCQFTWYCDGKPDTPANQEAWHKSLAITTTLLSGQVNDFTDHATYYHARYVKPAWAIRMTKTSTIDSHVFYHE